jgi:hypothetical protein
MAFEFDVRIEYNGSLFTIYLLTHQGKEWVKKNIPSPTLFNRRSLLVNWDSIDSIVASMLEAGLNVPWVEKVQSDEKDPS